MDTFAIVSNDSRLKLKEGGRLVEAVACSIRLFFATRHEGAIMCCNLLAVRIHLPSGNSSEHLDWSTPRTAKAMQRSVTGNDVTV